MDQKVTTKMQDTERPLDMLNQNKGSLVMVGLKTEKRPIFGILIAFDISINLVIELKNKKLKFIKGDAVESVQEVEQK